MEIGDIAQWAVAAFIVVGLVVTWRRNGKAEERRAGAMELEVRNIKRMLESEESGLGALNRGINEMKVHCAKVSTSLLERVTGNDQDINELKANVRGEQK